VFNLCAEIVCFEACDGDLSSIYKLALIGSCIHYSGILRYTGVTRKHWKDFCFFVILQIYLISKVPTVVDIEIKRLGLLVGIMGWYYGLVLWIGIMGWDYGLGLWVGIMGWYYGLVLWVGIMGWYYGLGLWVGIMGWDYWSVLWVEIVC